METLMKIIIVILLLWLLNRTFFNISIKIVQMRDELVGDFHDTRIIISYWSFKDKKIKKKIL